ncbi:MAG: YIP1 family protein [Acidobacteriota bacterium]
MANEENPYAPPQAPSYAPPPPPGNGGGARLPWEDRDTLGFMPALIETLKLIFTDPRGAFSRLRLDGQYVPPLIFSLLVSWVMGIINQVWSLGFSAIFSFGDVAAMGVSLGQVVAYALLYPIAHPIVLLLVSGIYHLSLSVLGGLRNSELGFEGSFKILSYAMASNVAYIVPIIGPFIGLGFFLYFIFIGFETAHRADRKQAILGALLPLLLCCLCGVIAALVGGGLAAF